jgi:hypothetical protein
MTSVKKIASNKHNALKSTGPKTLMGKHHSSGNAIKDGLFAQRILPFENKKDYEALLKNLVSELNPHGQLENFLVVQIANILHSHQRIDRAEKQIFVSVAKEQMVLRLHGIKYMDTVCARPQPYAAAETEHVEEDDAPRVEEIDVDNALSEGVAGVHEGDAGAKLELARQRQFSRLRNYLGLLWSLQEKRLTIEIEADAAKEDEAK